MRHLKVNISVIVFVCFLAPLFAQTEIAGIGPFKIGVTSTQIIHQLESELETNCIKVYSGTQFYNVRRSSKVFIAELIPDTLNEYSSPTYASFCPNTRVFYVSQYSVSGVEIKEAYLKFFDDQLYELLCERTSELIEALTIKYGEPKIEQRDSYTDCGYFSSANTIKLKTYSITQEWRNNNVIANGCIYNRYNSECEESLGSYFSIYNLDTTTAERLCNDARREQMDAKKKEIKRTKLSDF